MDWFVFLMDYKKIGLFLFGSLAQNPPLMHWNINESEFYCYYSPGFIAVPAQLGKKLLRDYKALWKIETEVVKNMLKVLYKNELLV